MSRAGLILDRVSVLRDGLPVTHDVSFEIPAGAITALIGPNGAGKSSLVLAASGRLEARGSITIDGMELVGGRSDAIRRAGVAAVPEGHHVLTGLTVADNLAAAASSFHRREAAGRIESVLDVLPALRGLLDRRAGNLSGGQQQMVAIGQGLVCRPRALLIDELSLGLAPVIVDGLLRVLDGLARSGAAVLLIEQFTAKALEFASTAHVISGGRLTFSGDARTLNEQPHIVRDAYLGTAAATGG